MKNSEILSLGLDEVVPDPEQPRQHFDRDAMERLKAAILAVGQLQPIRIRKVDDGFMIVDGQRRWLAMSSLAEQHPEDDRFKQIKAYEGDELDETSSSRRVVQVLSNIGEDLTPTEKAAALEEVSRAAPHLTPEELGQRIGVPKGQVVFLKQLASAPSFIQDFGTGSAPLPLWNLVTLVRLHKKLRKWDDDEFRRTEGEHRRIADREVGKLGNRARDQNWGKRKLQQEAQRTLERLCSIAEKPRRDVLPSVRRALSGAERLEGDERIELIDLLSAVLERLGAAQAKKRGRTRAA